jgi:hypothetical protein
VLQEYKASYQEQRDATQLRVDSHAEQSQRQIGELMSNLKTTYIQCIDDLGDNSRMAALWEREQGMSPGQSDPNAGTIKMLTTLDTCAGVINVRLVEGPAHALRSVLPS